MEEMQNDQKEDNVSIKLLACLAIAAVIVCIVFFYAVFRFIGTWEHRGLFGDMFGALNALFSGLAFAGIIYAILLQRKELGLQREELRLSRDELTQQTKVFSAQLEAMQQQYEFERQKVLRELGPEISGSGGTYSQNRKIINLRNLGGPISELECRVTSPNNTITGSLESNYLYSDIVCRLTLSGYEHNNRPEVVVDLLYKNSLGVMGSKRFKVPEDTDCGFIPISAED